MFCVHVAPTLPMMQFHQNLSGDTVCIRGDITMMSHSSPQSGVNDVTSHADV